MSNHNEISLLLQTNSALRSGRELSPGEHSNYFSRIIHDREDFEPKVLNFNADHGPEGSFIYFHLQSNSLLLDDALWTHLIFGKHWIQCDITYLGFWCSKQQYSMSAYVHSTPSQPDITLHTPLWAIVHDVETLAPHILYVGEYSYQAELGKSWDTRSKADMSRTLPTPIQGGQRSIPCESVSESQIGSHNARNLGQLGHAMDIIEPIQASYCGDDNMAASTTPVSVMIKPLPPTARLSKDAVNGASVVPQDKPFLIGEEMKLGETPRRLSATLLWTPPFAEMDDADSTNPPTPQIPTSSILYISSTLMDMVFNWTRKEIGYRRRIVHFVRHPQSRHLVDINLFLPLHRRPGVDLLCVSCIYWPGSGDCFITSSDILRLLQWLLQTPMFLRLEKCRIRRNLDRFQPHLISKSNPESFEFARMVRGFRNPRVVTVQKDMKVFPWRILPSAITSILQKHKVQVHFLAYNGEINSVNLAQLLISY
ncbi:uncharacterized protein ATNIH1004_005384 [Aspergillus tanneri]|uniref:DUF7082 domain-containing protein n=1 Tax=Aspergillus tanneri TaxID=1220188 RepID=A0A5M9MQ91_9EURO|nr:uncharacterized protein ATNIH1004_005384 [Aspergillus tanneri]KAA8646709.1 hypothetical protein ATNIH1004_005384 [Aspergillus tanneri]